MNYKKGYYVNDITRNKISKIKDVAKLNGLIALVFEDNSFTHYLSVKDMAWLFPCIGDNKKSVKVLYGKNSLYS